jgi:hypothetical protein
MIIIFLVLGFLSPAVWAETDLCDIIDLDTCGKVMRQLRRSSSASLPSPATSANLNPANVSFDRGFGVEAVYQPNNPLSINLASGTGRMGGALISQSLENSFFGNRVPEIDSELLDRTQDKKQYKSKKFSLALGGKLFRRKHFALDVGILLKRHSEIKKINPGIGLSGRLGPIHLGASIYKDDLFLDYENTTDPTTGLPYSRTYGIDNYTEKFTVHAYSVGTRIKSLSLDAGVITTSYDSFDEKSVVNLYSASLALGQYLINFAIRNEVTPFMKVINDELVAEEKQSHTYAGVQRAFGKHLIFGVGYNFYLLKELSLNGTYFF